MPESVTEEVEAEEFHDLETLKTRSAAVVPY